jgi:hypothetical protein
VGIIEEPDDRGVDLPSRKKPVMFQFSADPTITPPAHRS